MINSAREAGRLISPERVRVQRIWPDMVPFAVLNRPPVLKIDQRSMMFYPPSRKTLIWSRMY